MLFAAVNTPFRWINGTARSLRSASFELATRAQPHPNVRLAARECDSARDQDCLYFTSEADEGVEVSAETLKVLGDRGIKLGLRIYAPMKEDENVSSRDHA